MQFNLSGQVDETEYFDQGDPLAREVMEEVKRRSEERRKHMSGPGLLRLPRHLDERRLEYGIPDGVFEAFPTYDRVYVYQIEMHEAATFKGTKILKPDDVRERLKNEACRGILVAAGPVAMDYLWSHGVELGDRVRFVIMNPWAMEADMIAGHTEKVLLMRAGDICGCEDLELKIRAGKAALERDKNGRHLWVIDGQVRTPIQTEGDEY